MVEHHHVGSFGRHLVERFERGREFGRLRIEWKLSGTKLLLQASVTLLPLRLVKLLLRGGKNARRAGRLLDFASASPLVALAQASWLRGELAGYLEAWKRGSARARCDSSS